jgi:gamma-D-glutamyl-L-lysine dipeptidyl-peptidase
MEFFVCENVFVPLRSGPSHRSEMLSQVLFGEKYVIIDQAGGWIKIETLFDKYVGWIDGNHVQHSLCNEVSKGFVLNRSLPCFRRDKTKMMLEAGCEIYEPEFDSGKFRCGENIYKTGSDFREEYIITKDTLTDTATKFINSPYIWGGRIPSGLDCSGFTQLVYKIHKRGIPRNSWNQAEIGEIVNFLEESMPGDLVFFDNDAGRITHVGMIMSKGLVIHASGRVRIDPIDHQGIFKHETGKYSHRLRMIKRLNF